jgi:hypothetical protein
MKSAKEVIVEMEKGAKNSFKAVCDGIYNQAKNLAKIEKLEEEKMELRKELEDPNMKLVFNHDSDTSNWKFIKVADRPAP